MAKLVKVNIVAELPEAYVNCFLTMLETMEYNGSIGKGQILAHTCHGGWDFRPKFTFDTVHRTTIPQVVKFPENETGISQLLLFDSQNSLVKHP